MPHYHLDDKNTKGMRLLLAAVAALFMAACASIGHPNGGEYDYDPPVFMGSTPSIGSTGVKNNKVTLTFNENVQVQDVMNKVVVSPAQRQTPAVVASGRKVTVEIKDTLIPNTTYTIDFSDAIKDLNEGNVLDGLAVAFSTGDTIDSLRISGMVFEARTLEPAQGMIVGVYSNLSDTAITTLPLERIAKTNQLGQFTIRGLKAEQYRIFALNDLNHDYHWDRSEDIAFYDTLLTPTAEVVDVADTLQTSLGEDSIVMRHVTMFRPNDVLLTWFNEGYQPQYLKDYSRTGRNLVTLIYAAPSDSLPAVTPVDGPMAGEPYSKWSLLSRNAKADTLEYFITDSVVLMQDTLRLAVTSLLTDTLDQLSWKTDTLKFVYKPPFIDKKKKEKEFEKLRKEQERKIKDLRKEIKQIKKDQKKRRPGTRRKGDSSPVIDVDSMIRALQDSLTADSLRLAADTIPPKEVKDLDFAPRTGQQEVNKPLFFTVGQPLHSFDQSAVVLEMKVDTLWDTLPRPDIVLVDSFCLKRFKADIKWQPGASYRLTIDSAAVVGVDGTVNKPIKSEFAVRAIEDYSALYMTIVGLKPDQHAIVQLLNSSDKAVDSVAVVNGEAAFPYVIPGDYYVRMYIDSNDNGVYDTGSLLDGLQPEETFYYPKKLTLKKNWDVEQKWDIYEQPVDLQKPEAIKKNKPKTNKVRRRRADGSYIDDDEERRDGYDDEEDYEFGGQGGNNFFGPGNSRGTSNIGNNTPFNNIRNFGR